MGRIVGGDELVAMFSIRLDETGTDGRAPFPVVGGAVASLAQWEKLEAAWEDALRTRNVSAFHYKEFNGRTGEFDGWSDLKASRFEDRLRKICQKNTLFRLCAGVDSAAHADVKRRMKGIKGFMPDSDYGLCFRYLLHATSEQIAKNITDDFKIMVMIEDGPFASGAVDLYERIVNMTGTWRPAKHAHRLDGISVVPKGRRRSLEAADYLVGIAGRRTASGRFLRSDGYQHSIVMNDIGDARWYVKYNMP
jgi:hypothetical protein